MDDEDESDQTEHAGSPDKAQVGGCVCMCMKVCVLVYVSVSLLVCVRMRACLPACVIVCVCGSPDKAQVGVCLCLCLCLCGSPDKALVCVCPSVWVCLCPCHCCKLFACRAVGYHACDVPCPVVQ